MLTVLGPAKTIDTSPHHVNTIQTVPGFLDQAETLMTLLKVLSPAELRSFMKISDKLAHANFERIAAWKTDRHIPGEGLRAMLSFSGEVFNGLQARSLEKKDLEYAQEQVRILSGLYGVLRPLDLILPYRLEMGTKMQNPSGSNLYDFWNDTIPGEISKLTAETRGKVLINLASNEYFKSIDPKNFPYWIITPVFREQDGDGFRNVTIYAKKARGMMLRFIIRNRIDDPEQIKAFDDDGYYFNASLSGKDEWIFCR
mgnify:CR=1 FL=1